MHADVDLRSATSADAGDIARTMRRARRSLAWLPVLHTLDEDLDFIRNYVLVNQNVTVAVSRDGIVGFIAIAGDWIEHLYIEPNWARLGIGTALIESATSRLPLVQLHCFQANVAARCFYERLGFVAASRSDGRDNEEQLPDILYVRRSHRID